MLLTLILSICFNLLIPIIFIKIGKPLSKMKINIISGISFFLGYVLIFFSFIFFATFNIEFTYIGISPLFLTLLGNWYMKKKLSLPNDPSNIKQQMREQKRQELLEQKINKAIDSGKYKTREDMEKRHAIIGLVIIAIVTLGFFPMCFLLANILNK